VVGFVTWARALNGKPIRVFSYADEIMANIGEQTPEEAKLGFANLGGLSLSDALDEMFKDQAGINDSGKITGLLSPSLRKILRQASCQSQTDRMILI
jgi:hypothetical protein